MRGKRRWCAAAAVLAACQAASGEDVDVLVCDDVPDLALVLGEDGDAFVPLDPGTSPLLERGPQGGQHLRFSLLLSPDLAATQGPWSLEMDATVYPECDAAPCDRRAGRTVISVANDHPAVRRDGDEVTIANVLVVVDWWPSDLPRSLAVHVADACGAAADARLAIDPLLP